MQYLSNYKGNNSDHFTWSGLTSGKIDVNIFHNDSSLSEVLSNDGGSLSVSLGELGCSTGGSSCMRAVLEFRNSFREQLTLKDWEKDVAQDDQAMSRSIDTIQHVAFHLSNCVTT